MSRVADKLTTKLLNYMGENNSQNKLQKAVIAAGLKAAIKYIHYQSMKNIYKLQQPLEED